MDQTVDPDLSMRLESVKIDSEKRNVQLATTQGATASTDTDQRLHPSHVEIPTANSSIASSESIAGQMISRGHAEESAEHAFEAAQNVFLPHSGSLLPGSLLSLPQSYFPPFALDGVHYPGSVTDYHYLIPPMYGSLNSGMQHPLQTNSGYVFGSHVYPYPTHNAGYHPALSPTQYIPSPQGLPIGSVVMLDAQDPNQSGLIMLSGFADAYPGSFPPGTVPELGMIPGSFPQSQSLRASAPAWIEWKDNGTGSNFPGKHTKIAETSGQHCPPDAKISSDIPSVSAADVSVVSTNKGSSDRVHQQSQEIEHVNKQISTPDPWVSTIKGCASHSIGNDVKASQDAVNPYLPNGEKINSSDFKTEYDDAKHFIIKSYSEENVLKSIQYGVWASTPNGNKKLDEAFQDAQRKAAESSSECPVFLFFSVNGSRQFCGVAEMVGPVNHDLTMDFWEQHKWSGSFPVKWHIIKDLPNSQLRRIILENNENKPVTNSRDTQEVPLHQGLEMLRVFKNYPARTTMLDELLWFPTRKLMQDAKVSHWFPQSFSGSSEHLVQDEIGSTSLQESQSEGSHTGSVKLLKSSAPSSNGTEQKITEMESSATQKLVSNSKITRGKIEKGKAF